ncbi:hypothetical protein BDK51DRAFT_30256, partial [Blyttiomyces helicus]
MAKTSEQPVATDAPLSAAQIAALEYVKTRSATESKTAFSKLVTVLRRLVGKRLLQDTHYRNCYEISGRVNTGRFNKENSWFQSKYPIRVNASERVKYGTINLLQLP